MKIWKYFFLLILLLKVKNFKNIRKEITLVDFLKKQVVLYIGKYLGAERLLTRESTFSHKDDIQIFLECQLLFCHKENVVHTCFPKSLTVPKKTVLYIVSLLFPKRGGKFPYIRSSNLLFPTRIVSYIFSQVMCSYR